MYVAFMNRLACDDAGGLVLHDPFRRIQVQGTDYSSKCLICRGYGSF